MDKRIWKPLAMTLAVSAASVSYAHADVDIDNDGLIEISTLQELDLMRYDLAGTSLNGNSTGCPATGCNGYELVADLDFDTNGNGIADAGDLFWNNGEGWEPVGSDLSNEFVADFKGNGNTISNLWINQSNGGESALFGYIAFNKISDLVLASPDISGGNVGTLAVESYNSEISTIVVNDAQVIRDTGNAGGLISSSTLTTISDVTVAGSISTTGIRGGWSGFGGIVGYSSELTLSRAEFSGSVDSGSAYFAGGLVGFSEGGLSVTDSMVNEADISSLSSAGGIVGGTWQTVVIDNSLVVAEVNGASNTKPIGGNSGSSGANIAITDTYWDSDVMGISTAEYGESRTTSELQCPTMPGDVSCDASMYSDWDEVIWDFGTSSDYPVLR